MFEGFEKKYVHLLIIIKDSLGGFCILVNQLLTDS